MKTHVVARAVLLSAALSFFMRPVSTRADNDFRWAYFIAEGRATISSFISHYYYGPVTIPGTMEGYPVCAIEALAFGRDIPNDGGISSISIPSTVTRIGELAFSACNSLESVNIPDGVKSIEAGTFANCYKLASITFPPGVTNIGEGAFVYSGLRSVGIPSSVTSMGQLVFANSISLEDAVVPGSIKSIPAKTFMNCSNMVSVSIGHGITDIGICAFSGCSRLSGISLPGTLESIGGWSFGYCQGLTSLTVPGSVKSIGGRAFEYCGNLSHVVLSNGVTSVDNWAFTACSNLVSITIPASVDKIGGNVFQDCTSLVNAHVLGSGIAMLNTFCVCPKLSRVFFGGNAPRTYNSGIFNGSTNVTVYYLGGTTGWGATFGGRPTVCIGYVPVEFPPDGASVTVTGYPKDKTSAVLSGVIAGLPVAAVACSAFDGCTNLTEALIPGSVTNIGSGAFEGCPKLAAVYFEGDAPGFEAPLFGGGCSATVYRRVGAAGWGATFAGRPTALWYPADSIFTVSFDACGGTVWPAFATVTNGLPYGTLPVPARAGYTFAGWRTEAIGAGTPVATGSLVTATAAHTLYAAWLANTYTVTFDAGGIEVSPGTKGVTMGEAYGVLPVPVRENYTFGEWWTGAGGTVERVTEGTAVATASDHVLYAKWTGVASTVMFDASGGTADPSQKVVYFGSTYGDLPVPVRAGSAFGGWWRGAGGTGVQVTADTAVTALAGHTLFAAWAASESIDWQAAAGTAFKLTLSDAFAGVGKVTVTGLPSGLRFNAATRTIEGVPSKTGPFAVTVAAAGVASRTFTIDVEALPVWAQGSFNGSLSVGGPVTMTVSATGKVTGKISRAGTNYTFSASSYAAGGSAEKGFKISALAKAGKATFPLALLVTRADSLASLGVAAGTFGEIWSLDLYREVWKTEGARLSPLVGYYTATLPGGDDYGRGYLTFTVDRAGKVKTAGKLADGTEVSQSGTLMLDGLGRYLFLLYAAPTAYKGGSFFGMVEFVKPDDEGVPIVRLDGKMDGLEWLSCNPLATGEYGNGFFRNPELSGGWYSKLASLNEYYASGLAVGGVGSFPALQVKVKITDYDYESESEPPPKTSWTEVSEAPDAGVVPNGLVLSVNSAGTAFAAPQSSAPSKVTDSETGVFLGYNYDELENPTGLTFTFNKATGLFKGAFNVYYDYVSAEDVTTERQTWSHVVKKASFQGVLTQVGANASSGGGFFLWADKASYETAAGKTVTYPFNWSRDFLLLPN